jgi:Lon protease-like protein
MPSDQELDLSAVPLFPLPGVVLFPHAVLPLHIFEDRYRSMTSDAIDGDRLIAMALLKPGWEKSYYGRPTIEPVVCVGRILSHEKLADGKYNFLLEGVARARIVRELGTAQAFDTPYRVAHLERLDEIPAMEIDLAGERERLATLFSASPLRAVGGGVQFRQIVKSHLPTAAITDLAAFTFLDDPAMKQSLLEEVDVRRRVGRVTLALEQLAATMTLQKTGYVVAAPSDPSMN